MEKINNTTYRKVQKESIKDKIEVFVGDDKQPDFKPQFKVQRWDNEVNFSMRAEERPDAIVTEEDGKVKYITSDYEVHQYEKPEAGEDGGFEFERVLNQPPATNVLTATIQTKGLDFFYQSDLTKEEKKQGCFRPENVIGSYAVYHSSKKDNTVGGMEYKTGKAFHIYRPKAIDANGVEQWCSLDIKDGILTVIIPQNFLNKALYPVIVDPTFGYTSAGASSVGVNSEDIYSLKSQTSGGDASGTYLDKLSMYLDNAGFVTRNLKPLIATSSDGVLLTNGVGDVTGITGTGDTSPSWVDFNYTTKPSLSSSVNYLLGVIFENSSSIQLYYDTQSNASYFDGTNSFATPTNPGTDGTTGNFRRSLYATYSAPTPTAALTGTVTTANEGDIVTGGKTIILTLTSDTRVASGATFDAQRQNIIDGLDSAQSETLGWNNEVRDNLAVTTVVRTSDTVVTITLSAQSAYNITANETITVTIPATAVTGGGAIVATPTFTVTFTPPPSSGEIDFLQSATDTTDTNIYTFSSQNLGTAVADRHIIVLAVARKAGASFTLSGITVGGVTATIVRQVTNNVTNSDCAAMVIAAVPTGTTGNIVVTRSTTVLRCAIGVYRATGLDSITSYDNDSSTSADPSVSLDIPTDGFAIGGGLTAASSAATWTGLTEDADGTLESFVTYSWAHDEFPSGATGRTITIDFGTSSEPAGVFASRGFAASAAGPENLKTYNTTPVANIKTINTNPIANVKTLNTVA